MVTIQGLYNTAICYTGELEKAAAGQIKAVCTSAEIYSCIGGQKIYNYVVAFS